jgi:hypothetical protein
VVLIGHGTFDGRDARFNLRGPDITPAELGTSLSPVKRPLVLIDCASASGPFLPALSGPNRIVITAARSGNELNYARFGEYLAGAIADPTADLDKDGQVSLLEAYLVAGSRVAAFYKDANRLATEHPLLDDNGDKLGTPPDRFRALRSTEKVKAGAVPDGIRAHQISLVPSGGERALPAAVRQKRDELERSLEALRGRKAQLAEDDYYAEVEKIMVELARLYVESQ